MMVQYEETTLMIRHFPNIEREEKLNFFSHFGAVETKLLESKNKKGCLIFARFESRAVADAVLKKLHQTKVLGERLSVEFVRNSEQIKNLPPEKESGENVKEEVPAKRKYFEQFLQRLNSWTSVINFNQPPPVHLKYLYPPPSQTVLTNIVGTLAQVPKFYTQVLHLMNLMNLPCPFVDDFPLKSDFVVRDNREEVIPSVESRPVVDYSSDESEMPSDGEEKHQEILPLKRHLPPSARNPKRPKFLKPVPPPPPKKSAEKLKSEDVFETGKDVVHPKRIEVRVTADLISLQEPSPSLTEVFKSGEGFEKIEPKTTQKEETVKPSEEDKEEGLTEESVITAEELAANRISQRDQHILPVFKNYQPGIPSCRLYIKNLAKNVVAKDLHHIYGKYFLKNEKEEQGTMFDIRLMQEGRMKGQAFITLQNVAQAELALKETNGYILKNKPMVVQFARSSKAKTE